MMTQTDLKTTGTIELWRLLSFATPAGQEQINTEPEERRRELKSLKGGYVAEGRTRSDFNPDQMVLADQLEHAEARA